jgi:hypothetical protein
LILVTAWRWSSYRLYAFGEEPQTFAQSASIPALYIFPIPNKKTLKIPLDLTPFSPNNRTQ